MKTKHTILSLLLAAAATASAQTTNSGPAPVAPAAPATPPVPAAPALTARTAARAIVSRTSSGTNVDLPTVRIDEVTAPVEWTYSDGQDNAGSDLFGGRSNLGPVTFLGVSTSQPSRELSTQLAVPADTGLVVDLVTPGSPAEKAGLQNSDVLTKLDDQILILPRQLAVLVANHKEGESVKLSLIRKGQPQEITAVLGKQEGAVSKLSAISEDLAAKLGDVKILVDGKPQQALRTFTRRLAIPAEGAEAGTASGSSSGTAAGGFSSSGRVPAEAIQALKRSLNQAGVDARIAGEDTRRMLDDSDEATKSLREELKDMRGMLEEMNRKIEEQKK